MLGGLLTFNRCFVEFLFSRLFSGTGGLLLCHETVFLARINKWDFYVWLSESSCLFETESAGEGENV